MAYRANEGDAILLILHAIDADGGIGLDIHLEAAQLVGLQDQQSQSPSLAR